MERERKQHHLRQQKNPSNHQNHPSNTNMHSNHQNVGTMMSTTSLDSMDHSLFDVGEFLDRNPIKPTLLPVTMKLYDKS